MPATDPDPSRAAFYAALFLGEFLLATGKIADPFPAKLERLARRYFALFPPSAKA